MKRFINVRNQEISNLRRNHFTTPLLSLFIILAFIVGVFNSPPAYGKTVIKMQSAWPPQLTILGESAKRFADLVGDISGGELVIKFYNPNTLVPTLELFDAVSSGNLDSAYASPAYWAGKNSALQVFGSQPFGPSAHDFLGWMNYGGGMKLWQEIYGKQNIVPFIAGLNYPEAGGWFNKKIETVEDLKGLKVRWAGVGAEVLKELGVTTVLLATSDILTSLEKGVIDAAELSSPAIDHALGFGKGIKYYYFPGWHQSFGTHEFIINSKKWNSLTPSQQNTIRVAADAATIFSLGRGSYVQIEAMEYFNSLPNIEFYQWPPNVLKVIEETTPKVMKRLGDKNPDFAKAWNSYTSYMEKINQVNDLQKY